VDADKSDYQIMTKNKTNEIEYIKTTSKKNEANVTREVIFMQKIKKRHVKKSKIFFKYSTI